MPVTTISFFRFSGLFARIWAFVSMQLARGPLRRLPGIGFHKLLGTGRGQGFDAAPNFSVYAILATWPSVEAAEEQLEHSRIFSRYRRRADEHWTVFLEPTRAKGSWDERRPFDVPHRPSPAVSPAVGVLTRAAIRPRSVLSFWRSVPPVSAITAGAPGLHFKLGLGERPLLTLMTFSLWTDPEAIRDFAYRAGPHREAMRQARERRWFEEELFARFRVVHSSGTWGGEDPLALPAERHEAVA